MAEADNCLCSQAADSCLFPIGAGGIHSKQQGARGAIAVLTECLQVNAGDLDSRWLLNLAAMTVGAHPAGVPTEWLLPESLFASEHDVGRFRNVAPQRGVDRLGLAGGCVLEDFNSDGHLDIMASGWSLDDQLRLYINRGDGSFEDRTEAAGLLGQVGGLNLSHADYNNDGHADVLMLRGAWLGGLGSIPHSLLRGNGDGTFDDVTEEAGLLSLHPGQVGVWGDYDNDGRVDLFLGHEDDGQGSHPSLLYHNNGDGTFTECGAASGLASLGFVKGAAWGDYDNDGRLDLHVSRMGNRNLLLHNEGPGTRGGPLAWRFRDATAQAGVAEPLFSFASWFFDYDNDGWLDIFVAGFKLCQPRDIAALYLGQPHASEVPRLFRNNRNGTFTDVTREVRLDRAILAMGANFGDLDNDGFPDIYLGTGAPDMRMLLPNRMFQNDGGKRLQDVTTSGGFGHLQKGHGIAFGDIDGDGDQDIYAEMGGAFTGDRASSAYYENPGFGSRWISVTLVGVRSNRSAIGARLRVVVMEDGKQRTIYKHVNSGGSFGANPLRQNIGLGKASSIVALEVLWPTTGKTQIFQDVPLDAWIEIVEDSDRWRSSPPQGPGAAGADRPARSRAP
jgi:hypothetical protein